MVKRPNVLTSKLPFESKCKTATILSLRSQVSNNTKKWR